MLKNPLRRKPKKASVLQKQKQIQTNKQNVIIHLAPQVKPRTRAKGRTIAQGRQSQDNTRSVMVLSHSFPTYNEQSLGNRPTSIAAPSPAVMSGSVTQDDRTNAEAGRIAGQVANSLQTQSRHRQNENDKLDQSAKTNFASNKSANTSNIEIARAQSGPESVPPTNDVSTPSVDTAAPMETPVMDATITLASASGAIDRGVGVPAENAGLAESPLRKPIAKSLEEDILNKARGRKSAQSRKKNSSGKMSPDELAVEPAMNTSAELVRNPSLSSLGHPPLIDLSTGSAPPTNRSLFESIINPNPLKKMSPPSVSSSGGSGHRSLFPSNASTQNNRSFNYAMLNNPFLRDRQRIDEENSQSTEFL